MTKYDLNTWKARKIHISIQMHKNFLSDYKRIHTFDIIQIMFDNCSLLKYIIQPVQQPRMGGGDLLLSNPKGIILYFYSKADALDL